MDLADFVARQPHGSLGWFEGFTIEPVSGSWAKRLPAKLRDATVLALLPDGERICLVNAGEQSPIVLVHADGACRLVSPSFAGFVTAWAASASRISHLDHDGSRLVARHGRDAATTQSVPSARKALQAWLKAARVKPRRAETFDLDAKRRDLGPRRGGPRRAAQPSKRHRTCANRACPRRESTLCRGGYTTGRGIAP